MVGVTGGDTEGEGRHVEFSGLGAERLAQLSDSQDSDRAAGQGKESAPIESSQRVGHVA